VKRAFGCSEWKIYTVFKFFYNSYDTDRIAKAFSLNNLLLQRYEVYTDVEIEKLWVRTDPCILFYAVVDTANVAAIHLRVYYDVMFLSCKDVRSFLNCSQDFLKVSLIFFC
jgi:hypothetical protein